MKKRYHCFIHFENLADDEVGCFVCSERDNHDLCIYADNKDVCLNHLLRIFAKRYDLDSIIDICILEESEGHVEWLM